MEVVSEFHGLLKNCHGTLTENERSEIVEFVDAQEFNLAFETLCNFLLVDNRRVTPDLVLRIHSIGEHLDGVDPYLVECIRAVIDE